LKKLATIGLALIAMLAVAAVAIAQTAPAPPEVVVTGKVSPSKAGTAKKPKPVTSEISYTVNKESFSTVQRMEFFLPQGLKLSGKGFKRCSVDAINTKGSEACPKGSQVGTGSATALLGPGQAPLGFDVRIFVAGDNSVAMNIRGTVTDVDIAIPGKITKQKAPYGSKLQLDVPTSLQQPVPGTYAYLTGVKAKLGGKSAKGTITKKVKGKKVKQTVYFATTTGCVKKKFQVGVRLGLVPNPDPPQQAFTKISTSKQSCS
jgi:hypothetical protein